MSDDYAIILYDGECGFCDRAVKWIINHDRAGRFRFAARQSPTGQRLLAKHGLPPEGVESMILVDGDRVHTHSGAVFRIAGRLGLPWKMGFLGLIVPRFVRDGAYKFIAKRRNRIGRTTQCSIPTPAQRARILDDVPTV